MLGPADAQKWMAEVKWEYLKSNMKDYHTNSSSRDGQKNTGKIAQDLLVSFPYAS